jgi:hypothetical protein
MAEGYQESNSISSASSASAAARNGAYGRQEAAMCRHMRGEEALRYSTLKDIREG